MDCARHWKFALILALSGSIFGCKSPASMFGGGNSTTSAGTLPAPAPAATNPVAKAWKSTTDTVSAAFTIKPKTIPADDPVSLDSKPAKISANTYIATGRLLESRQEFAKAQDEYEKAVKTEPTNLTALVSLARLQDRQGRPDLAIATYQKALKAHPKSALVYNDLGLCYARKRDLASAVAMLHKAVELESGKPNYRNNLATVLVEAGRTDEALRHLQTVHSPAAAHYNLAFLLNHRGQADLARRHLQQALELDPGLSPAREMLAQISGSGGSVPAGASELPQIGVSEPFASQPQITPPALSTAPQSGSYDPGIPAQNYPPAAEPPAQPAEPVFHIGSEGIENSPADGPSVHQPTTHQYPAGASTRSPSSFHLEDTGYEGVLVVTHLVYGKDSDPAPEPTGLVADEPAVDGESADEPGDGDPVSVKPVSQVPTLQPVAD